MTILRRWIATSVAVLLTTAVLSELSSAAAVPAIPPDVCRVTFSITTGEDGIRDDSSQVVRLAGQLFRFEDTGELFHKGGTGDNPNETFRWNAELPSCASSAQLAQGFEFEHVNAADVDDTRADNWDLRAVTITDRDTGFVYYHLDASPAGRIHRFKKNNDQTWNTNDSRTEPTLDTNVNSICHVVFRVTTGEDGIHNDSIERIRLAGQLVLFEDGNGDGVPDARPLGDFHSGGTDDLPSTTFEWRTELSPCVSHSRLVHGFEFDHESRADDIEADNWNLSGLTITDGDTGFVYFDLDDSSGRILHRFRKNEDQKWNINQSRPTSDTDSDGDGLTDDWERHGFNATNDLTLDVDLPALGADPNHKDIFLELDWVNGRQPTRDNIQALKKAFAAAPPSAGSAAAGQPSQDGTTVGVNAPANPDGRPGITLHVDTGGLVDPTAQEGAAMGSCSDGVDNRGDGVADGADPDCNAPRRYLDASVEDPGTADCADGTDNNRDGRTDGRDPTCLVGDDLGDLGDGEQLAAGLNACATGDSGFVATKRANADPNRRLIFHYGVLTTAPARCATSGGQSQRGDNDFLVFNLDAGSLMHELGHNLNLRHGGFEETNCKPNYVSVMNYDLQDGIRRVGGGRILDFSPPRIALDGSSRGTAPLPPLVENNLTEPTVLDPTDPANRFVFRNANGNKVTNNLNASPDWDNDASTTSGNVGPVNLNGASGTGQPPRCAANTSTMDTLQGWDDWSSISLPFRHFSDSADGTSDNLEVEDNPTDEDLLAMDALLNTTDLGVTVTDVPDPVAAGSGITYRLTVTNHGSNPAVSVRLVDILPEQVSLIGADPACRVDGRTVTCGFGELVAYTTRTVMITVHVPADRAHNAGGPVTLVNHATVEHLTGTDPNRANDSTDEVSTVTGAADLAVTALAPVNPPAHALVGQSLDVTLRDTLANNGPSSPIDATVVTTATADVGSSVTPSSSTTSLTAFRAGEIRTSESTWTIGCTDPGVHIFRFTSTIAPAHIDDLDPDLTNNQRSTEITVECLVPVAINIKPGGNPNSINIPADTVPVAVLTTTAGEYGLLVAFDATTIQPLTVHFGPRRVVYPDPAGSVEVHQRGHVEDAVERSSTPIEATTDGDLDMVLHFASRTSGLVAGDTEACVTGSFTDRATSRTYRFLGCDAVRIVQP